MASLTVGTDQVRDAINNTKYVLRFTLRYEHVSHIARLLDDSDASLRRAQQSLERVNELASSPESDLSKPPETALQELKQRDADLRNEVQISTEIKVRSTCDPE
jgi:hypothetical protein